MQISGSGTSPIIKGFAESDDFQISLTPQTTSSNNSGTTSTQRDAATLVISGANVDSVFSVNFTESLTYPGTTITNLTPSVATFSGSATASWVANGTAEVQATNALLGTRIVEALVNRATSNTVKMTGYISGSLAADISSMFDNAISGVTASPTTCARFSNFSTNTRNTSAWFHSIIDDTAVTRESDGFTVMGLIGPHHILGAAHVLLSGQVGFVGSDGVGYVGTVDPTGGRQATITSTDVLVSYVRDATAPEIAAYNAANTSSMAATQPLSAAFSGGNKIKPLAMLPAAVWALNTGTEVSPNPTVVFPWDPFVAALTNSSLVPSIRTSKSSGFGIWDLALAPRSLLYTNGLKYANEFEVLQSANPTRAPFGTSANMGNNASGDLALWSIPSGSKLATNNASLGAGYPILLGSTHGGYFQLPWVSAYISQITTLMQSTAQAAGDSNYASYAPIMISLTGYTAY